ncbi:hypothetical protein Tco_0785599 [Tanacetum coccineum]
MLLSPQHAGFGDKKRNVADHGDPHIALKDTRTFNSGCSRNMTGNKFYLTDYQDYDGGFMCDRKNSVLFTETECLILSPDFKLPDEN